jgi:hypothetical protein
MNVGKDEIDQALERPVDLRSVLAPTPKPSDDKPRCTTCGQPYGVPCSPVPKL